MADKVATPVAVVADKFPHDWTCAAGGPTEAPPRPSQVLWCNRCGDLKVITKGSLTLTVYIIPSSSGSKTSIEEPSCVKH